MSSARVNLNRYWHKFEELLHLPDGNNRHIELINNQETIILNNAANQKAAASKGNGTGCLHPLDPVIHEIDDIMLKKFIADKNYARTGRYMHFYDESLYHGLNLSYDRNRSRNLIKTSGKYSQHRKRVLLQQEQQFNQQHEFDQYTNTVQPQNEEIAYLSHFRGEMVPPDPNQVFSNENERATISTANQAAMYTYNEYVNYGFSSTLA